jgi:hypothetical protein
MLVYQISLLYNTNNIRTIKEMQRRGEEGCTETMAVLMAAHSSWTQCQGSKQAMTLPVGSCGSEA